MMRSALPAISIIFGACAAAPTAPLTEPAATAAPDVTRPEGQHDFDFEFGRWTMHLRRLVHPLTGSSKWVELDGLSVVREVWGGRANLGEIALDGPSGHLDGLTLRLYNRDTHEWNITFANAASGELTPAMTGGFAGGRGEFYDRETLDGRPIRVRFVFSSITPTSFAFEQAFSADDGQTWEVNWVSTFTRVPAAAAAG